jgi:hypothetical protein
MSKIEKTQVEYDVHDLYSAEEDKIFFESKEPVHLHYVVSFTGYLKDGEPMFDYTIECIIDEKYYITDSGFEYQYHEDDNLYFLNSWSMPCSYEEQPACLSLASSDASRFLSNWSIIMLRKVYPLEEGI